MIWKEIKKEKYNTFENCLLDSFLFITGTHELRNLPQTQRTVNSSRYHQDDLHCYSPRTKKNGEIFFIFGKGNKKLRERDLGEEICREFFLKNITVYTLI